MFHYFTIKFHFSFFASFASNFLLRFTWVIFASKQNKTKQNSSLIFRFFSLFSRFFAIFRIFLLFFAFFAFFALNFSLRFDLVIFASKWNKTKRNSSLFFLFFHFFSLFFAFFRFFHFFSLNFCFASIFSLNFCLFYLRFSLQIFGVSHLSESC